MKRVLVTGAGGFIGSHLCEVLVTKGYKVRAMIRYNSGNCWGWLENSRYKRKIDVVLADIRNYDSVKGAVKGADLVFHLAALIGIPYSYLAPESYVDTNIKGTLNLLHAAKEFRLKKFIHTSTSEVYGTAQFVPINELHPVSPQSPYSATKAAADLLALSFHRSFDLPVTIIRPFNTYGPRQSARAVIPSILIQILAGGKCIELGSVHPTRDLTYISDTVSGFVKAIDCEEAVGKIINLGSNTEISIKDLAMLIARIVGVKIRICADSDRKRPGKSEVERLRSDNTLAKNILKWEPRVNLEQGLKLTIDWLRANKGIYKHDIYNI